MIIRYMSDLHLEFDRNPLDFCDALHNPNWQDPQADVLVIAGDITTKYRVEWIAAMAKHFLHVVYVYGNHEFYGSNFKSVKKHTRLRLPANVHVLDDSSVTLDGVTFHGGTLWTDFDKGNPLTYARAHGEMNDYKKIRDEKYSRIRPQGIHTLHNLTKLYLTENIKEGDVVVTHHGPTHQSVHSDFRGTPLTGCYVSDLSDIMLDLKPKLWFHGHVHNTFDYEVGDTRVLCNPRGYYQYDENPDFDEDAIVEI